MLNLLGGLNVDEVAFRTTKRDTVAAQILSNCAVPTNP